MIYDLLVIGSGPGGYVAAIRAAQLGLKTACVEKSPTLGGTCLNVGCIPSKALLHSTETYWTAQQEGLNPSYNWNHILSRKTQVVSGFTKGIEGLFQKNKVDWIRGTAKLLTPTQVEVDGQKIEAKNILLATGSEPVQLPFLPFDEKKILSSTGALSLPSVPKKLLIVGAGVIGVELGSVYRRLGSEVLFIEFLDRICPAFDIALSKALQKSLTALGMQFLLSRKVTGANGTQLTLDDGTVLDGDAVLVAVGRRPYTKNLGLENVGLAPDAKGFIPINASFQTAVPNIFALGDLVDGPMLAHKASEEGVAVAELLAGLKPTLNYLAIPNVAYTHPEVAAVGLTEEEVKKRNIPYKSAQFPFKANSRARCMGDDEGFVKLIAHAETHRLLGAHMIGPHASELIAEATLALQNQLTAEQLAHTCHPHPTLSEALKEAALGLFGKPIHI